MENFWLYMGLALGGHVFYLLKQLLENVKRNQIFDKRIFIISEAMNLIAIPLLVYIGTLMPTEILTMSPVTAIMIGGFGSSLLSGIINTRKPKDIDDGLFSQVASPNDSEVQNSKP